MYEDILPALQRFKPEALVLLSGADAMAGDPLMGLSLSNRGLVWAIKTLLPLAPRAIILGGGGYNPWTTVRYWTLLWAALTGREGPDRPPPEITAILASLDCARIRPDAVNPAWLTTWD